MPPIMSVKWKPRSAPLGHTIALRAQIERLILPGEGDFPQAIAKARTVQAGTIFHIEQGTVIGAEDMGLFQIEKLARPHIQRQAYMWATVHIGENVIAPAYDDHAPGLATNFRIETDAARLIQVIEAGKRLQVFGTDRMGP